MLQREGGRPAGRAPGTATTAAGDPGRARADAERLLTLPPGAFRPPPKVTSASSACASGRRRVDVGDRRTSSSGSFAAFLQRRKTLANALKPVADAPGPIGGGDRAGGVDPASRPETLTLDEFAPLARAVL